MVLTAQYEKDQRIDQERIRRERARENVNRSALNYTKSIVDVVSLNPEALAKVIEGENLNKKNNEISDKQFGMELAMLIGATVSHKAGGFYGRREGQEVTAEALRRDSRFNLYGRSALIEALKNMSAEEVISFAKAENIRLGKNPRLTTLAIETAIQNVRDVGVYDLVATHLKSVNMKVINSANKMLAKEGLPTMSREQFLEIYTKEKNRTTFKKNKTSDYTNPTVDELNGFITSQARHYSIGKELGTMSERDAYDSGYIKLPKTEAQAERMEMTQAQKDAAVREKARSDDLLGIRMRKKPVSFGDNENVLEGKKNLDREEEQIGTNKKTDEPIYKSKSKATPKKPTMAEKESAKQPLSQKQAEDALDGKQIVEDVVEVEEQTVAEREADRNPIRQEQLDEALEGEDVQDMNLEEVIEEPSRSRNNLGRSRLGLPQKTAVGLSLLSGVKASTSFVASTLPVGAGEVKPKFVKKTGKAFDNEGTRIGGASSRVNKGTANIDELLVNCLDLCELAYNPEAGNDRQHRLIDGDIPVVLTQQGSTLLLAFRGSDSFSNWVTNFQFTGDKISNERRTLYGKMREEPSNLNNSDLFSSILGPYYGDISFYYGFIKAMEVMYQKLVSEINSYKNNISNLIITGHSLGGAMAGLFTYIYQNSFQNLNVKTQNQRLQINYTVTFGSPRILIDEKQNVQKYKANLRQFIRVWNTNDLVSYMPTRIFGNVKYIHVGTSFCVDAEVLDNSMNYLMAKGLKSSRNITEKLVLEGVKDNINMVNENLNFMLTDEFLRIGLKMMEHCVSEYESPTKLLQPATLAELAVQLQYKSSMRNTWVDKCSLVFNYGLEEILINSPFGESAINEDFTLAMTTSLAINMWSTGNLAHKIETYKYYIEQLITRQLETKQSIIDEGKDGIKPPPNQNWIKLSSNPKMIISEGRKGKGADEGEKENVEVENEDEKTNELLTSKYGYGKVIGMIENPPSDLIGRIISF